MQLDYNPKTRDFFIATNDVKRMENAGFTRSTKAFKSDGTPIWFTTEAYAALAYWEDASDAARERLAPLKADFDGSFATDHAFIPPSPKGLEYFPYQRAGIAYALDRSGTLIGDEPGLGKTIQAIGVANTMGAERILVVCPASIRLNWQREIRQWSTIPNVTTYPVMKSSSGINPFTNYVIISYELMRNESIHAALCEVDWDLIIPDEAHYLKSPTAQRTRALFGGGRGQFKDNVLAERATKIVGLTGTPLPNRPRECYTLARALHWDAIDWMSYDQFCYRFNPSGQITSGETVVNIEKKGRLPELQARLRCNLMVRRLKADVLKDLPDKRYEMAYVEPNGEIKNVLQKEKLLNFAPEDLVNPTADILGQVSTVRREMGEAKVPRVVEHIKYLMDIVEIPKIVLFCHHRSVMEELYDSFDKYHPVMVRGGMSSVAKNESVISFQKTPGIRLFMGQLDAAGFGIDGLQKVCRHVVFAEPAWTPGTNEQAVDRCHRIGQHDNVIAQFIVVEGSFDERVLGSVFNKVHTIHQVLDAK
jgi:SWI/SNF-related matrix-associated actin-dependent regulator 1 of chromatin subfamily A